MSSKGPASVVIVDDSALIRALLTEILESDPRLNVVAAAKDAYEARELIKTHNPDVVTLDVEMPKMNGIVFLKNLMRLRPLPVVMISTLTHEGATTTLQALELGAVDFIGKPKAEGSGGLEEFKDIICEKVYSAARSKVRTANEGPSAADIGSRLEKKVAGKKHKPGVIVAIGASTGGTEAIKEVVSALPANCPPVVVVQHIPESFSASYAQRVNGCSKVNVYEAEDGQRIESGSVYIAPGHSHLKVERGATGPVCRLYQSEHVNRHRPSVEVLFDSVNEFYGKKATGVILTGMGNDGAEALLRMRQAGCATIGQDENTSVVWGMPGAAVKIDAVDKVVPLEKVASAIIDAVF